MANQFVATFEKYYQSQSVDVLRLAYCMFVDQYPGLIRKDTQHARFWPQPEIGRGTVPKLIMVLCFDTGFWYRKRHNFLPFVFMSRKSPSPSCSVRSFSVALARDSSVLVRGRVVRATIILPQSIGIRF